MSQAFDSGVLAYDVVVLGAGAAGLFCAGVAGQRGLRVLLLDHAKVVGEKIRISGGGRCNFTNLQSTHDNFLCLDRRFAKKILSDYRPKDFVRLVRSHGISFHEKHRGQLFCDQSSVQIINMLRTEAARGGVRLVHPVQISQVARSGRGWRIETNQGAVDTPQVVVATGGLPVPAIGASGFALDLARALNIPVTPIQPALVPLALTAEDTRFLTALAGLSLPVRIEAGSSQLNPAERTASHAYYGKARFDEDLLITHKGLSGPAVLQASSYWQPGEALTIDFLAGVDPAGLFDERRYGGRGAAAMLSDHIPERLAHALVDHGHIPLVRWAEQSRRHRQQLFALLQSFSVTPAGTLGWKKAEVMRGGVSTAALDPQTLQAHGQAGLFFIGECVDVTGHLGGHNFQWAWASGYACAQALVPSVRAVR